MFLWKFYVSNIRDHKRKYSKYPTSFWSPYNEFLIIIDLLRDNVPRDIVPYFQVCFLYFSH